MKYVTAVIAVIFSVILSCMPATAEEPTANPIEEANLEVTDIINGAPEELVSPNGDKEGFVTWVKKKYALIMDEFDSYMEEIHEESSTQGQSGLEEVNTSSNAQANPTN